MTFVSLVSMLWIKYGIKCVFSIPDSVDSSSGLTLDREAPRLADSWRFLIKSSGCL